MNTAATRNDWVGRVIDGKFPLLEWVGGTEQSGVFRTQLEGPEPVRAVIRLVPADRGDAETRLRLWAEAARLTHPHLMRIFESGRTLVDGDDLLYVVTEYAEESLSQVIPERPLSAGEAREMLPPLLDGLAYLHAKGLVHGHIKPANILVVGDRLKLPIECVQYPGPVRAPRQQASVYDAPELADGALSPAADFWSLGMTLVEALTQNLPRWDPSEKTDPQVTSEIPELFAGIARVCLRRDPARRASVGAIRVLLATALPPEPARELDPAGSAEIAAPEKAPDSGTPSRRGMMTVGIAFPVVLVVIALLVMRAHKPEPSSPAQAPAPAETAAPASQPPAPAPAAPAAPSAATGGTAKGAVAQRVMPELLASANRTIHGTVKVRIRAEVDANGAVSGARFDEQGSSRYFSAKALEAARQWTFKPALDNGRPVPSVWLLRFEFRQSGPEVTAQEVSP